MPPRCAICSNPLVGSRFVILETEVVHRGCAALGIDTQGQKIAKQLAERNADMARVEGLLARSDIENQQLQGEVMEARTYMRTIDTRISALAAVVAADKELYSRSLLDLAMARAERDAAKAEVTRLTVSPVSAPVIPQVSSPSPEDDPTAIRFSLLELDSL